MIANITASYNTDIGEWVRPWLNECLGAYYITDFSINNSCDPVAGNVYEKAQYLRFDASRCSSVYSNDTDTLNPDSVMCRFLIKY